MQKIKSFVLVIVLVSGFLCTGSFGKVEAAAAGADGPKIIHMVFFWLKEGTSQEQRQNLIDDCNTLLRSISSVRHVAAGPPAESTGGMVDDSYGVGLVVHFDDKAGLEHYASAPRHLEFIQRHKEKWERVQVYDLQVE